MIGNPYYQMLGLLGRSGATELTSAVLVDAADGRFSVEGRRIPIAGRAKGLVLEATDEGGMFLCAGNAGGWFVLCRLEEC